MIAIVEHYFYNQYLSFVALRSAHSFSVGQKSLKFKRLRNGQVLVHLDEQVQCKVDIGDPLDIRFGKQHWRVNWVDANIPDAFRKTVQIDHRFCLSLMMWILIFSTFGAYLSLFKDGQSERIQKYPVEVQFGVSRLSGERAVFSDAGTISAPKSSDWMEMDVLLEAYELSSDSTVEKVLELERDTSLRDKLNFARQRRFGLSAIASPGDSDHGIRHVSESGSAEDLMNLDDLRSINKRLITGYEGYSSTEEKDHCTQRRRLDELDLRFGSEIVHFVSSIQWQKRRTAKMEVFISPDGQIRDLQIQGALPENILDELRSMLVNQRLSVIPSCAQQTSVVIPLGWK